MPPKKAYPPRKIRLVAYISKAEQKAMEEIRQHYHQPTLASALRMMIDKQHARIELAPTSDKAE